MTNEQIKTCLNKSYDKKLFFLIDVYLANDGKSTATLYRECIELGKKFIDRGVFDKFQYILGVKYIVDKILQDEKFRKKYCHLPKEIGQAERWQVADEIAGFIYAKYLEDYIKSLKRSKQSGSK